MLKKLDFPELEVFYTGASMTEASISQQAPTLFYFFVSAEETLATEPFDQPALHWLELWKERGVEARVISVSLPYHSGLPATEALERWAEAFARGEEPLEDFLQNTAKLITSLLQAGTVAPESSALMGLSRGALIALHLLAKIPQLKTLVGFAPLTALTLAKEFASNHNARIVRYSVEQLIPQLWDRSIQFFIGNRDTRVGTRAVMQLVCDLADAAYDARVRSPHIGLEVYPSIGHQGHGTPSPIFLKGAAWAFARCSHGL